ncbi:MAG: fibrobacter succinogenes major paralogous domain-containing protein, partial [Defluviitaleaceae bacterium]|nr:fibrobacter succinogenes major paralogous domain-containing protein [Defluviitaleaceae bacterium]
GEFALLNNAINSGSTSSDAGLLNNWFGMYGGSWWSGFALQGGYGYYWSSTQNDATNARVLSFGPGWVNPALNDDKQFGLAVRCVL